jgi:polyhydroxyalkanoate synthase
MPTLYYLALYVLGVVLAQVLFALLLWWAHLRFWHWRLGTTRNYDLVEELRLPDGGVAELRRLHASSPADAGAQVSQVPVLLVHGLAMNHHNHDIADQYSLGRYLRDEGRDVWLLTLRSGRTRFSVFGHPHGNFAAMSKYDLPSAVATVLERTGQPQLDLAGFSMGGILVYASLGRGLQVDQVRRVALFSAPGKIRPLGPIGWARILPAALVPSVPMRLVTRTFAFAPRWVARLLWWRLYHARNMERITERSMLWNAWEDIPGRLGSEFVRWAGQRGEITVDGVPILQGLAEVAVPVCFFAGSVDWLAPVWTVRAGYDAWGSALPNADKHFVQLGREHGHRDDYGHCDVAFGRHVRAEVFAPAARFLATGALSAAS